MAFWKRIQRQLVGGSSGASPRDLALVAASGLFDREWYLAQYPDVRASSGDPIAHFVGNGGREGRDPGPKFSTRAYLARYPEVAGSGLNPLLHYLRTGQSEGRQIEPSDRAEKAPDENIPLLHKSDLFDAKWYRTQYPDIAAAGIDPAAHYLASGANEGRDPGPHFSTAWYLTEHKDIAATGANPLVHYLLSGKDEGRAIAPAGSAPGVAVPGILAEVTLVATSDLFNRAWYLSHYADIAEAEVDPATHYTRQGYKEGRDPGPRFSTSWYLNENKDVARAGLNPLVHYLRVGKAEGRPSGPNLAGLKLNAAERARMLTAASVAGGAAAERKPEAAAAKKPDGQTRTVPPKAGAAKGEASKPKPAPARSTPAARPEAVAKKPVAPQQAVVAAPAVSDAMLLATSEWFDSEWYLAQYPETATSGLDPVAHYLELGVVEGRDPGPRFSTKWYLAEYPDVAGAGHNPLVHYLKNGKSEGREIAPSPRGVGLTAGKAAPPLSFARKPPTMPAAIAWQRDLDAAAGIQIGGVALGTLGDDTSAWAASVAAVLRSFARLARVESEALPEAEAQTVVLRAAAKPSHLGDAWYINAFDMRLRFLPSQEKGVARAYQYAVASATLMLIGEAFVGAAGGYLDIAPGNPFCPILTTFSDTDGTLTAVEILPFPSLSRGGLHYGEACAQSGNAGYLADLRTLSDRLTQRWLERPAPALAHVAVDITRAVGAEPIFQPAIREWLGAIMATPLEATGTPQKAVVGEYLRGALSTEVTARKAAESDNHPRAVLTIPGDAIPTISAMIGEVGCPNADAIGAFIVADNLTAVPKWQIALPPDAGLRDLQPGPADFPVLSWPSAAANDTAAEVRIPLAIRFLSGAPLSEAELVLPAATRWTAAALSRRGEEAADNSVSVIVPLGQLPARAFANFIESLKQQTAPATEVIVVSHGAQADLAAMRAQLARQFPGRYFVLEHGGEIAASRRVNMAAAMASGRFLLFAQGLPLLQDPRTLEVLCAMAGREGVASAGCVGVAEVIAGKNRYFELQSAGLFGTVTGEDTAEFFSANVQAALPFATYPVAANTPGFFMVPRARWSELGGFDAEVYPSQGAELDFALRAIRAGGTHLCTSAITATVELDRPPPNRAPARTVKSLSASDVAALRAASTIVTELHG
ncbi:MAG: hypothetical protein IT548_16455 [Alphaproteobacteria bacterium]|nr:hypothetical protein [Alphaproteobacteria bacterium]